MPIISYQYKFSETENKSQFPGLSAEAHRRLRENFQVQEWLYLRYEGGCEVFLAPDKRHDAEAIWQTLREGNAVPPTSPLQANVLLSREAVFRFLQIATGIAGLQGGKKLLEILQGSYIKAVEHRHIGPYLHRLFQRGIWLHEKARQETDYFHYAAERETVMRELAGKILGAHPHLSIHTAGNYPSLPLILDALRPNGEHRFVFWGREGSVDQTLLLKTNGVLRPPESFTEQALDMDILLIFPSPDSPVDDAAIQKRMRERHNAPLLIFYFEGNRLNHGLLKKINDLYIFTEADISLVIKQNKRERKKAAGTIENWIGQEVEHFYRWLNSDERSRFAGIIGSTSQMQRIFELISRIARTDITVLIDGESGTGKELVAKAIHQLSARSGKPFIVVNCGAIPENLLESELFGYVRGAFTGAVSGKQGLFETAHTGTIFLDEIGELPQHLQVKLLRFLQEGEMKRVGSNETIHVDVRVLAATNKELSEMVGKGLFRSDLYYRLNVIQLTIPPLRERPKDIPLLVNHFLKKFSAQLSKEVTGVSPEAMQALQAYRWPGNVRELENALERAVALAVGQTVLLYDLPPVFHDSPSAEQSSPSNGQLTLKEMEKKHILQTLDACDWNYELACKQLNIGRTTLWRKLREYNLEKLPGSEGSK